MGHKKPTHPTPPCGGALRHIHVWGRVVGGILTPPPSKQLSGMFRGVANTNFPSILERFGTTRIYPNGIQHGPTRRSFLFDPTRHDPIFCSPSETRHESTRSFETRIYTKHEFTRINRTRIYTNRADLGNLVF